MEKLMTEQEIRESARELAEEMNFRLLREIGRADIPFETILWVENVTVVEIRYPEPKRGIFSRLGGILRRLVWRLKTKIQEV